MNLFVDRDTNRVSIHVWSHLPFPFLLATSCISPPFLPVLSTGHFLEQTWERKIRTLEGGGKKCLMGYNEEIICSCTFCINQWVFTPRHKSDHLIVTVSGLNAMPRLQFALSQRSLHRATKNNQGCWVLSTFPVLVTASRELSFFLCSFRKKIRETQGKINGKGSLSKFKVHAVGDATGRRPGLNPGTADWLRGLGWDTWFLRDSVFFPTNMKLIIWTFFSA